MVWVSEDGTYDFLQELESRALHIFEEFEKQRITETIEICEKQMWEKISKGVFSSKCLIFNL